MGLAISVNGKGYYAHSYSSLHTLRCWISEFIVKEPLRTERGILSWGERTEKRFPQLFKHSDCEGWYVPVEGHEAGLHCGSVQSLIEELKEIGESIDKAQDYIRETYKDLYACATVALAEDSPMEFH